jgi:hypothetical protein
MRKVKNLTENKDLINTFRKLKTKTHLNKINLKKNYFYYAKFCKNNFFKTQPLNQLSQLNTFTKKFNLNPNNNVWVLYDSNKLLKLNLMFIN